MNPFETPLRIIYYPQLDRAPGYGYLGWFGGICVVHDCHDAAAAWQIHTRRVDWLAQPVPDRDLCGPADNRSLARNQVAGKDEAGISNTPFDHANCGYLDS